MSRIRTIHFNALSQVAADNIPNLLMKPRQLDAMLSLPYELRSLDSTPEQMEAADTTSRNWSSETAARSYMETLLQNQDSDRLVELTSPSRPELVPDMRLEQDQEMPLTETRNVSFVQTSRSLPIFGTRSIVEVDSQTHRLVAMDGLLSELPDRALSPIPKIGMSEVVEILAKFLGEKSAHDLNLELAPTLCYYPAGIDERTNVGEQLVRWHLVYHFEKLAVSPQLVDDTVDKCLCCGASSPWNKCPYDFLVDGNTGEVLLFYPAYGLLDIPVVCTGSDVDGNAKTFDGIQLNQQTFQLTDPLRGMDTCDAGFQDIKTTKVPATPLTSSSTAFPAQNAAAVTAHCASSQVFDFFNHVLKRNGVDGKGMKLISMVNCYNSDKNNQAPPIWHNAMWSQGRMWYGSTTDSSGNPLSTARFLDVMAHELAHGVTSSTANLIYKNQSGALNESFSDIFGILIKNWYPGAPNPLTGWVWTLGDGWNGSGTVLRNMADPSKGLAIWPKGQGQPSHMRDYVFTTKDFGGVHINSGIHNHAFYKVVTTTNSNGAPIIPIEEVAILYYVTLTKLTKTSNFSDCRRTLLNVATTRFTGLAQAVRDERLKVIGDAYTAVGIV